MQAGLHNHDMTPQILTVITVILYGLGTYLAVRRLHEDAGTLAQSSNRFLMLAVLSALAFHALLLRIQVITPAGLNLSLIHAASLVVWMIVIFYLLTGLARPVASLGAYVLPLAAVTLVLAILLPAGQIVTERSPLLHLHIAIAMLAYSLLALGGVQALILNSQEKALREHQPGRFRRRLPPLETMEGLLFSMITIGFALLTLTLLTGLFFSEEIFGKPLAFKHHIVLSIGAWCVFGVFLLGHWRWGWRGRNAVHWTLGGLALLLLGYFGTKFVLEFVLH